MAQATYSTTTRRRFLRGAAAVLPAGAVGCQPVFAATNPDAALLDLEPHYDALSARIAALTSKLDDIYTKITEAIGDEPTWPGRVLLPDPQWLRAAADWQENHKRLEHEYGVDALADEDNALDDEREQIRQKIIETPATTLDGFRLKAKVADYGTAQLILFSQLRSSGEA